MNLGFEQPLDRNSIFISIDFSQLMKIDTRSSLSFANFVNGVFCEVSEGIHRKCLK